MIDFLSIPSFIDNLIINFLYFLPKIIKLILDVFTNLPAQFINVRSIPPCKIYNFFCEIIHVIKAFLEIKIVGYFVHEKTHFFFKMFKTYLRPFKYVVSNRIVSLVYVLTYTYLLEKPTFRVIYLLSN